MSNFSKQYVETSKSSSLSYDFDIDEIAKDIKPGNYIPTICEGFGFIAICRTDKDEIRFAIPRNNSEFCDWYNLQELRNLKNTATNIDSEWI